jgi:hypothetical protein
VKPQTAACHVSISWVTSIQPMLVQPTYLRSSLISSSHLGTTVAKEKRHRTESSRGFQTTRTCCHFNNLADFSDLVSENEEQVRLWRHVLRACVSARAHARMGPTLSFGPVQFVLHNLIYDSPLEDMPRLYLIFPTLRHSNMVDARIFRVPDQVMDFGRFHPFHRPRRPLGRVEV